MKGRFRSQTDKTVPGPTIETVLGCRMKDNSEVDLPQAGVRHAVKATIRRSLLSIVVSQIEVLTARPYSGISLPRLKKREALLCKSLINFPKDKVYGPVLNQ